ncbi:MAG: hypothetical protein KDD69_09160 [Bdellovibrionales bacterium]|nr:hypothetical protein [Bdellovibrionales bacterium]
MSRDILYLRGRSEEHAELVRILRDRRFDVHVLRYIEEVERRVAKRRPAALIVDASSGEAEVSERLFDLTEARSLYDIPLVFIGKQVVEHSRALLKRYARLIPVNYPFRPEAILEQFGVAVQPSEGGVPQPEGERRRAEGALIEKPDPARLKHSLGGKVLAEGRYVEDFDDELLLPQHSERESIRKALDAITKANLWLGAHARRSAFVASAVTTNTGGTPADDAAVRAASLVLNWGLARGTMREFTADLLGNQSDELKRRVSDGFKMTADFAAERLKDERAAEIVRAVAELLRSPSSTVPTEVRSSAECVLLTEAADRACWKSQRFEIMGAHRVLRSMRSTPLLTDKKVLEAMSRVLGEAVLLQDPTLRPYGKSMTIEEKVHKRRLLEQAKDDARTLFGATATRKVQLFDLVPGMRLAEPLVALDGQVILAANTVIDLDMMMRVLQLAAVRPMHSAVSIVR